ncbi:transporter substrate-binding domain-containing protein [Pseudomonas sp. MH9.2]|uniref:transporter substrate-binding domain-containing protein n=1 Tax=unclassified Pseudomonas TaxID=196821 RepID=UPI002AC8BB8A|nr:MULTISPECIES: transporter substrate-binding domain-containing protein [unclassified Pseudomonas]MEB0008275.1 transporter substrate-binding domain-containing protein [Pseudomonas sp. RTB2]MEB0017371.1 transporter substrate-binding domain-containing protein [Pseudomonas sp. RTB3]MEB0028206.1 transporter substrate-binding domain-containing protein [Pseudomonas sp. MH9.2]MEB0149684.1 transporter substrate-binding domain-containing protein [Pseudomonas sp. CCC2.2]MEB0268828.1 transporter substra
MQLDSLFSKTFNGLCVAMALAVAPLTAHADQLADVKKAGELVVGTELQFAPFDFTDNGKQKGLNAELFEQLGKELGVKIKFLDLPWPSVLPGLEAKKFDVVAGPIIVTKARKERYHFVMPIAEATVALMIGAKDETIKKPEDISGKTVGAGKGSAQLEELKSFAATLPEKVTIREYVDNNQAYADLAAKRIVAVANSLPNISYVAAEKSNLYKVVMPPFGKKSYFAYLGRKDDDANSLIAALNAAMLKMHEDGRLASLQKKWLGAEMDVPKADFDPTW